MYSSGNREAYTALAVPRRIYRTIHLDVLRGTHPSEPRAISTPSCPGAYHPLRAAFQSAGDMNFTDDGTIAIFAPTEMREARHLCGWTLRTLSRYAGISLTQLCQFETGQNGLRTDQLRLCREILVGAVVERAERIQTFIAKEQQKAAQTALRYANSEPISSTDRMSPQSHFLSGFPS
jgi:transcriptional regulator with XRE-family HTH domain